MRPAQFLFFLLAALLPLPARAITLDHFGFGSIQINSKLPLGTRPLLLIVANYAGDPQLAPYDWDSLIFSGTNSLTEYYREVSNGRFSWTRAGRLDASFTEGDRTNNRSRMIEGAAQQNPTFDFGNFDANMDGTVTGDELSILIIHNQAAAGGQTGTVQTRINRPSASPISLHLKASDVAHRDGLMTFVHEICHTLGAIDIYGHSNSRNNVEGLHEDISLMGPTIAADSNRRTFHLDPWHKLAFGWSEPRIVSLRGNGDAVIPAAQSKRADAPVLLFDPLRGPEEFYLLEFRTTNTGVGAGFDANVRQQGLLIWHIRQKSNHSPMQSASHATLPYPTQSEWTVCKKCLGLFYRGGQASSRCPASGAHEAADDHNFSMVWMDWNAPVDPGQQQWRWCRKCQGLYFGGNTQPTYCPVDNGSHDGSQSANYILRFQGQSRGLGQRGWRWCSKCQGLFAAMDNRGSPTDTNGNLVTATGVCPVSLQHDGRSSAEYNLHYEVYDVFNEAASVEWPPILILGVTSTAVARGWTSGESTPYSRWFSDRSEVRVRFRPKRLLSGGDELEMEWISELPPPSFSGETWVDYNGIFSPGDGSYFFPFRSLSRAVDDSPFYRRILLKPGAGSERLTIRQSVRLEAPLGPVTIGP